MQINTWKEIDAIGIDKFKKILESLITYYETALGRQDDPIRVFQKKLLIAPNIRIFCKSLGLNNYEYFVQAHLISNEDKIHKWTWVHIDGIQRERDEFKNRGISDHPAFHITNLTDIYNENSAAIDDLTMLDLDETM
ncbi:hypothetical protein LEP1GSC050_2806 [Leptospira broomii serovar Hurstbridge str. 5399]|uniref:Uncharacterized protein n=1 Tax=Leptospira broomii serovar Hurstbridge str. 5399 TaxID=1049789 RepID=T0GIR3_9LEPT|nr:hypothetical protein [Leptospira broomii]EQA45278.1 hypothetical protein LEP1GSC050_2806 [Leptospira broomii serovar Hurstbridge str. 5399]